MRLTCPNCRAQYEVDSSAIPDEGRDVQCSNCGRTWFQERIEAGPLTPSHIVAPDVQPDGFAAKDEATSSSKENVEGSILNILREEAEREQRARAQDRQPEADETLAAAERPIPAYDQPRSAPDPAPEKPLSALVDPQPDTDKVDDAAQASAADRLRNTSPPDLDAISSTLQGIAETEAADQGQGRQEPPRSGFSSGFALVIVAFGLALVSYSFAPTIVRFVPQAEPHLASYVQFVDTIRVKTDSVMVELVRKIESN